MKLTPTTLICLSLGLCLALVFVQTCNEAVCASLVSKCILLKACGCDVYDKGNCSCCKNCSLCLSQLYVECCSCVGMCPRPELDDEIYKTSSIEDLPNPLRELFNVLTESNVYQQWSVVKYPTYKSILEYRPDLGRYALQIDDDPELVRIRHQHGIPAAALKNCTVAFLAERMSLTKCKSSCKSMGAAKMRWFHGDSCCQCIGSTCLDYGVNEARCKKPTEQPSNDYPYQTKSEFDDEDEWDEM